MFPLGVVGETGHWIRRALRPASAARLEHLASVAARSIVEREVFSVVQKTLDYITESLIAGKTIEFRDFGVFEIRRRAARVARNPRTNVAMRLSPRNVVVFQPGKHASTFGANPLACAAALATIGVIEDEKLVARAAEAGAAFVEGLQEFVEALLHFQRCGPAVNKGTGGAIERHHFTRQYPVPTATGHSFRQYCIENQTTGG